MENRGYQTMIVLTTALDSMVFTAILLIKYGSKTTTYHFSPPMKTPTLSVTNQIRKNTFPTQL